MCGSRKSLAGTGRWKALWHDLVELHSHDPTVSPQRSHQRLYFAPGRHGRVHYRVVSVHWISSCHKIPCEAQSSTPAWINSTSTTCPLAHRLRRPHFTGSWPQYAICPIAHCSLPNAHCPQLPTRAGTEPREMWVKSFSVVNKEESFGEKEREQ